MATGSQRPESPHGRITWPRVLSPRALAPFGRQSVLGESAPHSMCLIFVVGQSLCALWLRFTCRGREMLLRKAAGTELPVSIGRRKLVGRCRYTWRHNQLCRPRRWRWLRVTGRRFAAGGASS